jgi:hypothetical protein
LGHNLSIDGGFGGIRYYEGAGLKNLAYQGSEHSDTNYVAVNYSSASVYAGVSYFKTESYKMTTNKTSRAYWRTFRLYALFTAGVGSYNVSQIIYNSSANESTSSKAETGYEVPGKKALGYRIGLERIVGFMNSPFSFTYGVETGSVPGLKLEDSPSGIFLFHIGAGISSKPTQL